MSASEQEIDELERKRRRLEVLEMCIPLGLTEKDMRDFTSLYREVKLADALKEEEHRKNRGK
jgi:hypothetical protein